MSIVCCTLAALQARANIGRIMHLDTLDELNELHHDDLWDKRSLEAVLWLIFGLVGAGVFVAVTVVSRQFVAALMLAPAS